MLKMKLIYIPFLCSKCYSNKVVYQKCLTYFSISRLIYEFEYINEFMIIIYDIALNIRYASTRVLFYY